MKADDLILPPLEPGEGPSGHFLSPIHDPENIMPEAFDSFDDHEPTENQRTAMDVFRQKAKDYREALDCLHPSREKSLALTHLEETLMWSHKAAVAPPPPTFVTTVETVLLKSK